MTTQVAQRHNHGEAFMLMTYRCDVGCHTEVIWNSRDGVTPFAVKSRDGMHSMQHVAWTTRDIYAPTHIAQHGDRVFVGMARDRAREHAVTYVDRIWDHPKSPASRSGHWATREEAINYFAEHFYSEHGAGESPDLIVIGPRGATDGP